MSEEIADFLAQTREYIEDVGWVQNTFVGNNSSVCSVGAMMQVLGVSDLHLGSDRRVLGACSALADLLHLSRHESDRCTDNGLPCSCVLNWITNWNDDEARTMDEVLDAFAKAEKVERMGYDPDLGYSDV